MSDGCLSFLLPAAHAIKEVEKRGLHVSRIVFSCGS